jgi:hypothetical protein
MSTIIVERKNIMAKKVTVWEANDGIKFSTETEADMHDKQGMRDKVKTAWIKYGGIEDSNELLEWILLYKELILEILDVSQL